MDYHEAANIFPLDAEHLDELADDIKRQGQKVPIETLGGKILDGRRRFLACQKAKVQPRFREVSVDDPVAYVLSLNLHRRHLTTSQLAMVGARARELFDKQAKDRQKARKGNQPGATPASLPELPKGDSRDQAGKAVGVGGKSIDYATKILKEGVPELIQAVDEGRMAISTAAILASEPEEKQREESQFTERGRRGRKYTPVKSGHETNGKHEEEPEEGKLRGVGIIKAEEAINCLTRIPKNDALRKRGFQLVTDWIRRNK